MSVGNLQTDEGPEGLAYRQRPHAGGPFCMGSDHHYPEEAPAHHATVSPFWMNRTRQGNFPNENLATDGFERASPVTAFPADGYGLYDMIGNVWEWTADWYSQKHESNAPTACCIPENPGGGPEAASYDSCQPKIRIPRKVL